METVDYDGDSVISAKVLVLALSPADSPVAPNEKDANRFYAELLGDSQDAVESVVGMSGSPVFALRSINDVWHYSVIGVQSGWFSGSRVLFACPFAYFAAEAEAAVRRSSCYVEQADEADA